MEVKGDPPLWEREEAPVRDPLPPRCDLAILGGGIAGASTALHARDEGLEVVLLEAGRLASRASGRNDGQILCGLGESFHRLAGQWGRETARRLRAFLAANREDLVGRIRAEGLDCGLRTEGGLRLASTPHEWEELRASAAMLEEDGVRVRLLEAGELRREVPLLRGFHGGLFQREEALVDPRALVRGIAALARTRGARVLEGTPVSEIEEDGTGFLLRLGPEGRSRLRATAVLHATSALAPELDRSGFLARRVFPFRGQILSTRPLPAEVLENLPFYAMSANFCYEYFRRHGERLTLGGMRWSVKGEENGTTDDAHVHPRITANLVEWMRTHLPAAAETGIERVWSGIMAGTPDGLPLVGPLPGRTGELCCLGFNGYGLGSAFRAARLALDWLCAGRSEDPAASLFLPRRLLGGAGVRNP